MDKGQASAALPAGEPFRVSVYYDTEDQARQVQAILESVKPGHSHIYNSVIDGWLTRPTLEELRQLGLTIVVTAQPPATPAPSEPVILSAESGPESRGDDPATLGALPSLRRGVESDPVLRAQLQQFEQHLPRADTTQPQVYQVRLKERRRPEWQAELAHLGTIVAWHTPNLCTITLAADNVAQVRALPYVGELKADSLAERVTPSLLAALHAAEQASPTRAEPQVLSDTPAAQPQIFDLVLHTEADLSVVKAIIAQQTGIQIVGESTVALRFRSALDPAVLVRLATMPQVKSLSVYTPPTLFCDRVRALIGVESINSDTINRRNAFGHWDGAGEIVAFFDSGVDSTHPDLKDRVAHALAIDGASATDQLGHGTHVAGIIGGTGKASGRGRPFRGMAPGVRLVSVGITDTQGMPLLERYVDLGELLKLALDSGATIINLSWGTAIDGSYDHGAASVDRFVYEHPDILVVVAAGNAGAEDPQTGFLRFNTIGTPASAKNVLTVGASATDRAEAEFAQTWAQFRPSKFQHPREVATLVAGDPDLPAASSSRGPTDFDSVKPDVLAPGTFILSTRATQAPEQSLLFWKAHERKRYVYLGGSSMAAPVVAGAAAVVRQYLKEQLGIVTPSAALLKAILIASVKRLPSVKPPDFEQAIGYPDFDQGFGRIDLASILPHPGAPPDRKLVCVDVWNTADAALESRAALGAPRQAVRSYTVQVPNGVGEPLRIVLAWTDYPGNAVQNNLQLEVQGPSGRCVGNAAHRYRKDAVFDDTNQDGTPFDKRNNVEQVIIDGPQLQGGTYRIRVIAQNTPYPPQGYALCVCGVLASELHLLQ